METAVCETSVGLNCMKQLADYEILLNFVATNLQDMMMMTMATVTITTTAAIIMFVLQFFLPDSRRVSPAV